MLLRQQGWPTCCRLPEQLGETSCLSSLPPARPPAPGATARALGPQKGKRARRRRRRTYRARLARAAGSLPGRSSRVHPSSAHPALGQIQRSRARGRGPHQGSGVWERGRGGGEQQVLQLPSLPTARPRRARDAARGGKRARSANEFTFFFSPALSPSPFPPAPSSLLRGWRGRPGVFGSRPGAGGQRRRGRRKKRRER